MIYLDNAATTKISPEVLEAMMPYLTDNYGNPGSIYDLGLKSKAAVEKARKQVAELIHCDDPEKIVFTSGGTEANNMVFFGLRDYLRSVGKTRIIASSIEHDSVLNSVKALEHEGFRGSFIKPNISDYTIDLMHLSDFMNVNYGETGLVSIMSMNNELGSINNIGDLCRVVHSKGALFHTDCVQGESCIDINVENGKYDFVSLSGHKINAPKGIGALYIRDKSKIKPLIYGGSAQEYGLRGGTMNVANIVGFGRACECVKRERERNNLIIHTLSTSFLSFLIGLDFKIINNGGKIISMYIPGVDAQTLIMLLSARGVCVSAGSACNDNATTPSHVLTEIGLTPAEARSVLRVSFSHENTIKEVFDAAQHLVECVKIAKNI